MMTGPTDLRLRQELARLAIKRTRAEHPAPMDQGATVELITAMARRLLLVPRRWQIQHVLARDLGATISEQLRIVG